MDVFEGGIRVPFIASWPGHIPAGTTSDLVSVQYDMMATFADLLNYELENTDGVSILPTLVGKGGQQQRHEFIYWEFAAKGGQVAIRWGKWKGVKLNVRAKGYYNAPWMIFDLEKDSSESIDVANEHPDLAQLFDEIVFRERQPAHIREWEFIAPKTNQQ